MANLHQNPGTDNYTEIAELQVSYRPIRRNEKIAVRSSEHAANFLRETWDEGLLEYVEQFKVLLLNRAAEIIGIRTIGQGGLTGCVADLRNVFQAALLCNADSIIVSHNHPSGQMKPSDADRAITKRLVKVGEALDLSVLDHIILTADSYYSFADEGEM